MSFSQKTCLSCSIDYIPTSNRQKVCTEVLCKDWLRQQNRTTRIRRRRVSQPVSGFVYGLVDPRTSQVRYVGITTLLLEERLKDTLVEHGRPTYKLNWLAKLKRLGLSPTIILLETVTTTVADLFDKEVEWIALLLALGFSLVNGDEGGKGGISRCRSTQSPKSRPPTSAETRAKMSASLLALWQDPLYRENQLKVRNTPEHRAKASQATKKLMTPEVRQHLSETSSACWKDPEYRANQVRQYFLTTHCSKGHEFTPENTAWLDCGEGRKERRCRECGKESSRKSYQRKKQRASTI